MSWMQDNGSDFFDFAMKSEKYFINPQFDRTGRMKGQE